MTTKTYIRSLFAQEDEMLQSISKGLDERGLPQISVPAEIGKTLYLLVKMVGAKNILEVGSLGGYSSIWLARGLPEEGKLISLELDEVHARFAEENIQKAGLGNKVRFIVGDANESIDELINNDEKYDFFFIDADKPNYLTYLEKAIQLSRPGSVIVADNLFQEGRVFDLNDESPSPVAIREFNQMIASDPRLDSIILPIGDGLGVCRVKGA